MRALTKSELIERIYERISSISKKEAQAAVEKTLQTVISALSHGIRVDVRSFGTFNLKTRKAYKARNPKTGESVDVPAKYLPCFHAGKALREMLNKQKSE